MKKTLFLLFASILLATPSKELSVMDAQVYTNINQNDAARSFNSNIKEEFNDKVEIAIDYNLSKNEVYVNEVFYVDVNVRTNYKVNFTPSINFATSTDLKILNKNINITSNNGEYKTRIYMQANTVNAKLNEIKFNLFRNTQEVGNSKIVVDNIVIKELPFNKDYTKLIASDLEIKNTKCTEYDENSIICGMDLRAKNTNFNNFEYKNIISQSITNFNYDYENARCSLALIFAKNTKNFNITYFNLTSNSFESIKKDIVIESEEISTQTDLNPITKEINFYLQIASLVLALICLIVVLVFKKYFSLIAVAIAFIAFSFIDGGDFRRATLKANVGVRILPTHTSTIFYKTNNDMEVKVLTKKDAYTKIALDEDTSGWVKNEDIE